MSVKVRVIDGGRVETVETEPGRTIMEILSEAGFWLDAPCGGNGRCGKCRVCVKGGVSPAAEREKELLTPDGAGMRLACLAKVTGDADVTIPHRGQDYVETSGWRRDYGIDPMIRQQKVSLPEPGLADPLDDESSLKKQTGLERISHGALASLAEITRDTRENLYVLSSGGEIAGISLKKRKLFGMAADIGTTTVVAYFYELETGRAVYTGSGLNRQRAGGADVISRIAVCREDRTGLEKMRKAVVGQLNGYIGDFCQKTGARKDEIAAAVFAGNTTMLHMAAGLNPANIANAPFIPVSLFGRSYKARELELEILPSADVYFAPCVSSYVGGDITAGMLACSLDRRNQNSIYIDIGTNGEMALLKDGEILCCSTAAGPAFEGAHIKYGTGGVAGAVSHVAADENGVSLQTIGGLKPVGICGSGLIDSVAAMLKLGILDETGRICGADEAENAPAARNIIQTDEGNAFLLDAFSGICVTQKDVREVQLAKSAIAAGISSLLHEAGLPASRVEELILAGGFGSGISPASACAIGLFPMELREKTHSAGNAAGSGASEILLSRGSFQRLEKIRGMCRYIELSGSAYFKEQYIDNMYFSQ